MICSGFLSQLFQQGADHFSVIADQPIIRYFENRRIRIGVDRYNDFAFLHSRKMLDRTGDTAGNVNIGLNGCSGLAYLTGRIYPTGIYRRT